MPKLRADQSKGGLTGKGRMERSVEFFFTMGGLCCCVVCIDAMMCGVWSSEAEIQVDDVQWSGEEARSKSKDGRLKEEEEKRGGWNRN